MPTSVIINGAKGHMGKAAVEAVNADPALTLAAALGAKDDLAAAINEFKADVVVDLTIASAVYSNTKVIIEAGAHPVIGTTGLTPAQLEELTALSASKNLGGLIVPNFSIGAVLMMRYAQDCAKYLPHAEIIEMHHNKKQDAPSGTAMRTAELIHAAQGGEGKYHQTAHENAAGSRGAKFHNVALHAIRLPGFLAHQRVIFGSTGETLTVEHNAINRDCFMPGVLLACKKVSELNTLTVGLDAIL